MDEFEKMNETLENEAIETEEVVENKETEPEVVEESVSEAVEESEPEVAEESVPEADSDELTEKAETATENKSKKKFIIERTIIIACCIFLATALVFGCLALINVVTKPNLEGVWILTKDYYKGYEDQASVHGTSEAEAVYFDFDSNGDLICLSGSTKQSYKWAYSDKDGKISNSPTDYFVLYLESNKESKSVYSWKTEGSVFSEKTLVFEAQSETGYVNEFIWYDGSELPENNVKPYKDFKVVKEIIGSWKSDLAATEFTFNEDGTFTIVENEMSTSTGVYIVDSKAKTFKLKYNEDNESSDIEYSIKKGNLVINGIEFAKQDSK